MGKVELTSERIVKDIIEGSFFSLARESFIFMQRNLFPLLPLRTIAIGSWVMGSLTLTFMKFGKIFLIELFLKC